MSLKHKPQSSELDHIRDTLTDLVQSVGENNSEIKQVKQELTLFKHEVRQRFDQQDKRFDKIEDTLAIIVNHLKNK